MLAKSRLAAIIQRDCIEIDSPGRINYCFQPLGATTKSR
jgi:hypothetical protein